MRIFLLGFYFRVLNALKRRITNFKNKNVLDETEIELILNPNDFIPCNYTLPDAYILREFTESDFIGFHKLMLRVNMGYCPLPYWKHYILPGGFWVVEHIETKNIVGAEFAAIDPHHKNDYVGTLEWLASDPSHRGLRIGPILASKVAQRLIDEGFTNLRLGTQKHREVVIRMYARQGWKVNSNYSI